MQSFVPYLEKLAKDLGGSFLEYSDRSVVITIPITAERFQSVAVNLKAQSGEDWLVITSKICEMHEVDKEFTYFLEKHLEYLHARFIAQDNFLGVAAMARYRTLDEAICREMLLEVATTADHMEDELVGTDIN